MTSSTKKRIAQIRQGQVPKGCKKSRKGTIPVQWEICTIGDIATVSSGSTPSRTTAKYWNGEIPWVTTGELSEGCVMSTHERISHKAIEDLKLKVYPVGTLLMAMYGQGKTRGTTAVLGIDAAINQACAAITVRYDLSPYLYYYLQSSYYDIRRLSNVGNQENLNADIIKTYPVALPPLAEQRKIAKILATQDRVIEMLNRKIEQLKLLKKYYLRKMFPRHGKTMPEVRFQGFTGAWERKRLDEVFFEHTEKGNPELPALTIVQGGGTIKREESERKLQYDKNSLSSYKVVGKGDFIVHLRSFEGGLELATTHGLISPAYDVFRGKAIDTRFYYAYFRSAEFIRGDLTPHVYGIRDGRSIDIDGMKSIRIPYAPLIEQRAIGNFIATVDNQIALHQQKHDEEERKKKALMQLLLTGIVRVPGSKRHNAASSRG